MTTTFDYDSDPIPEGEQALRPDEVLAARAAEFQRQRGGSYVDAVTAALAADPVLARNWFRGPQDRAAQADAVADLVPAGLDADDEAVARYEAEARVHSAYNRGEPIEPRSRFFSRGE